MSINYTDLKQAIQDYVEDTETTFVNNLDRFIRNTEDRILHLIQIPDFRKNDTSLTTSSSTRSLDISSLTDLLAIYSIALNDGSEWSYLLNKDVNFLDEAFPSRTEGVPRFYGIVDDDTLHLAPVPDAAYSIELNYYARPESIVDAASGTTWIGDNAEYALLYGCLSEAYTFLKGEEDLILLYETKFDEQIDELMELGVGRSRKDDFRTPRPRMVSAP